MRPIGVATWTLGALGLLGTAQARHNYTNYAVNQSPFGIYDDRPDGCPPCFNCQYDAYQCAHFADCDTSSGRCTCPPGFGTEDCSEPVCGSLADGKDRIPRTDPYCECDEGWEGVNCNVCKTNEVCNALMPENTGGVCYQGGVVINENFQMCNITNRKILDLLKEDKPQVTFSCNTETAECGFQFWVDQKESFYCGLDDCTASMDNDYNKNSTNYRCENIQCKCIPGRMLCGAPDSINLDEFLAKDIKGPASFSCLSTEGGSSADGCKFQEPNMNDLIQSVFGDESILLQCRSGECLYETNVPGYQRPIKTINTPLIAGVIAGCALFVVAVILLVWYLSRTSRFAGRGPVHLDDDDDENAKLMAEHKPATLSFENVSYHLNGKQILSGIHGIAHPGQVMAIMGASGAGKTTFLDILARKNKRGVAEGQFYVNGEKVLDSDFKSVTGFVDQEDTMLSTLTVHETILTSALLRLPRDMGFNAKEARVYEVERQLGILSIKDQLIGSEEGKGRGISGGEKRRVGIACELVTSPSILFLDEPTSGLDAFNAFNVTESLVTLAKSYNRTVVFTIHQPRSNIVALFDQLVLLAKGKMVYSGEFANCQSYFDQIGYSCPPGFNIADYLVDLTMHADSAHSTVEEDGLLLGDDRSARPSSTRAIKSIHSVSGMSMDNSLSASPSDSLRRPRPTRRDSVKQKQDKQLYTRKKAHGGQDTPGSRTDDESTPPDSNTESGQQWLRLSRQQHQVPPQILDDPHQLPPAASGAGTDLDVLVSNYARSEVASGITEEIHAAKTSASNANGIANGSRLEGSAAPSGTVRGFRRVGWLGQFSILAKRTWKNLYRDPFLMLMHYAIAILLAVLSGFLFYGLTDDIKGFQNRMGLFFFMLALFGFSTLTSLNTFSSERQVFLRERANGYYSPITYFSAKVLFDIVPLRLLPPIIMGSIVYPMVGFVPEWPGFLKYMLVLVLFNFAAASICLFIGIVFRNYGVANLVGSLVMLFSLLFAGLLLNHDAIPKSALWLQDLSIFHYGFEALIVNEATYLTLIDHKYGIDIEVPGASILSSFGFNVLAFWRDVVGLAIFTGGFIVLAFGAMHFLLVEKR